MYIAPGFAISFAPGMLGWLACLLFTLYVCMGGWLEVGQNSRTKSEMKCIPFFFPSFFYSTDYSTGLEVFT